MFYSAKKCYITFIFHLFLSGLDKINKVYTHVCLVSTTHSVYNQSINKFRIANNKLINHKISLQQFGTTTTLNLK